MNLGSRYYFWPTIRGKISVSHGTSLSICKAPKVGVLDFDTFSLHPFIVGHGTCN